MKKPKQKVHYFGEPHLTEEETKAVARVLKSKWIGFGKESIALEQELIHHTNAKDGAIVNSCTAALHLALLLRHVETGDEIITTPLTFASTVNTMLWVGAKPVFVDIKPDTLNIDEDKIEQAITPKTKGIVVVHFGGLPCNMTKINAIAKKHDLFVNEDAAHALGAKVDGKMVGDTKNLVCFSFYANKNLTTVDGGFLATPDSVLSERARSLRLHGLSSDAWKRFHDKSNLIFEVTELGYKYSINDVHAAIGRVQMKRFPQMQKKRSTYAKMYDKVFAGVPGITLQPKYFGDADTTHALHLYTIVLDPKYFGEQREQVVVALRERGVFATVHYWPVHLHKLYRDRFGFKEDDYPIAENVGKNILTLPLLPQVTPEEARFIAETSREVLESFLK
jgi:dTDP-4-amino-4,6-dideoxygalactose transaminase